MIRFCIVSGKVKSKNDGDIHHVGVAQLARLYNLHQGQYRQHRELDTFCKDMIHLNPLHSGNYFDANERYPA